MYCFIYLLYRISMTTSRAAPASITEMTVTAITIPDVLLIQGFVSPSVESSSRVHSSVQIFTTTVCPLFRVNGVIPLALTCAASCPALLPFMLVLKIPVNTEVEEHSIVGFSKWRLVASVKLNCCKSCSWNNPSVLSCNVMCVLTVYFSETFSGSWSPVDTILLFIIWLKLKFSLWSKCILCTSLGTFTRLFKNYMYWTHPVDTIFRLSRKTIIMTSIMKLR